MQHPIVLSIAGHDPTGGAGIQADIEAIGACGGRAVTALTCITVQDTGNVYRLVGNRPQLLREQVERLFADLPIAVVKIGLLGDAAIAVEVAALLRDHPDLPVVFDPVLASGAGAELAGAELLAAIREQLLPLTWLLTPNSPEARRLAAGEALDDCAARLLARGCRAVLITGTHESDELVVNRLYRPDLSPLSSSWPRLPASYHGSGCTLAAAAAAFVARGLPLEEAVARALAYTWNSLDRGSRPGGGQWLPNRLFDRCAGAAAGKDPR